MRVSRALRGGGEGDGLGVVPADFESFCLWLRGVSAWGEGAGRGRAFMVETRRDWGKKRAAAGGEVAGGAAGGAAAAAEGGESQVGVEWRGKRAVEGTWGEL